MYKYLKKNKLFAILLLCFSFFFSFECQKKKTQLQQKTNSSLLDSLETIKLEFDTDFFTEQYDSKRFYHKAQAQIVFSSTKKRNYTAGVKLRGEFRADTANCPLPQLKIKLKTNQKELKNFDIVLPCKNDSSYLQYLAKEYLLYQMYEQFCSFGLKTKWINLQIINSKTNKIFYAQKAFVVESDANFCSRKLVKEIEMLPIETHTINPVVYSKMLLFQYLIGNNDWNLENMHNIKFVKNSNNELYPIPYDFDFAAIVHTPYTDFDSLTFYSENEFDIHEPINEFVLNQLVTLLPQMMERIENESFLTDSSKRAYQQFISRNLKRVRN